MSDSNQTPEEKFGDEAPDFDEKGASRNQASLDRKWFSPRGQWVGFSTGIVAAIRTVIQSGSTDRITSMIAGVFAGISALCIVGLLSVMFTSVVFRYFLNSPIEFAEEVIAFLLALTIFSAFPFVTMKRAHIQIDLLMNLTKRSKIVEAVRRLLVDLGVAAMVVFLGLRLFEQASRYLSRGTVSEGQEWPLAPIVFVMVGLLAVALWVMGAAIISAIHKSIYTSDDPFSEESF